MPTVKLSQTYTVGSATFEEVVLREPKLADYRVIGPVAERQAGVVVFFRDAIWAYVDRLVTAPAVGALSELALTDALAVEEAVNDFFIEANRLRLGSASSSSASVGDQATSSI